MIQIGVVDLRTIPMRKLSMLLMPAEIVSAAGGQETKVKAVNLFQTLFMLTVLSQGDLNSAQLDRKTRKLCSR